MPTQPALSKRYRSIAGLLSVLTPRPLLPFWLAIGLTFAAFGFLVDVTARGRSATVTLALNVLFSGTLAVGYAWMGMTGRRRLFSGVGLAALLTELNAVLIPLKPATSFITVAAVRGAGAGIDCAVAGHHPVLRARGAEVEEITQPQLAVGMFPDAAFEAHAVDWRPGDLLALVTDGLLEVFDAQDRELGSDWARQVLAAHYNQPLASIAERLLAEARAHGKQLDDQTLLLIRRLET